MKPMNNVRVDNGWVIFEDRYCVVGRHLLIVDRDADGIQVYKNTDFTGALGRMYLKNGRLHIIDYDTNAELAYYIPEKGFMKKIEDSLPKITTCGI